MAEIVYVLCALTSLLCAILLIRGYKRTHAKLLFWSSVCFLGFALNNTLLFVDFLLGPMADLSVVRILPALAGLAALIYGLVREAA